MHVGADLDGTLDVDPANMASLLMSLRAAGHRVSVLTSAGDVQPTETDLDDKTEYLRHLGFAAAYDTLVVLPYPPAKPKAKWCKKHGVDILLDNDATNAYYASRYCTVLVPWNSVIPAKLGEKP